MTQQEARTPTDEEIARAEFIKAQGVEYSATFVPQSRSRNAGEKTLTLNWRVRLSTKTGTIETDYMQGIGHVPGYTAQQNFNSLEIRERDTMAAEQGKYRFRAGRWPAALPAPKVDDVLYSLLMDSDVLDAGTFEEWAENFGMDTDSRKAEETYRACLDIALKMRRMFGDDGLKTLRELFENF